MYYNILITGADCSYSRTYKGNNLY